MTEIAFRRIDEHEALIVADGETIGNLYRQDDVLHEGAHYYVVVLDEDWRGPVRVHERHRIREIAEERIRTHPLWT